MISKKKTYRELYPEAYERHKERTRRGRALLALLENKGYERLVSLATDIAYEPGCPPGAPCRCRAKQVIERLRAKKHRRHSIWTDDVLEAMEAQWDAGERTASIAKAFGTSETAVKRLAQEHGWKQDRLGRKWPPEMLALAKDLWERGYPSKDIGQQVGRSHHAVLRAGRRYNWGRHPLATRGPKV